MIALIDHYDSFSFNVLDWLVRAGVPSQEIWHIWCDDEEALNKLKSSPVPTVFGPGPNAPSDVPLSLDLAKELLDRVPLLGICLGHQIFGQLAGATVKQAVDPWHGRPVKILVKEPGRLFTGVPMSFEAVCYNSLVVSRQGTTKEWKIIAVNEHGESMALERQGSGPLACSVQFHPESFLSEYGSAVASNWLKNF